MADLTTSALRTLERQHGAISIAQLSAAGVGRRTRQRLERRGVLERAYRCVYRLPAVARSLHQRCAMLCLAHPAVFVTGPTAGALLGLRRMPRRVPLVISALHPLHVQHPGVVLRRTTQLLPTDVVRRRDGIAVASPARLAFDLAGWLGASAHRSVVEQLLHDELVTVDELVRIGERLIHPARRGSRRFFDTLAVRSGAPLESDPELAVADALWRRGVPVVAQETWLDLPNGARARLDLSVPDIRWGVEVDVHPEHLGTNGTTSDKRRDRQCHLIGWEIERVTALDLLQLEQTAEELTALYHLRRRSAA